MSEYMLLFSLGPVQSFIAQARKTRDLWLGSFLLSLLMEASMTEIKSEAALIFPEKPFIEKNIPDLTNKYVAIFDTFEKAEARAKQSEINIKKCWESICKDVQIQILERYAKPVDVDALIPIWDRQTNPDTFFEIFWVIVERGDTPKYAEWLKQVQRALDARKQLRHIKLLDKAEQETAFLEERGEKSTISGEREALHGRGISREEVRTFWTELAQSLVKDGNRHNINPDGEERLDAIDTVKRFAYLSEVFRKKNVEAGFPSTSSIATATFVERLLKDDVDTSMLTDWLSVTKAHYMADMQPDTIPYLYKLAREHPHPREILKRDGDCYFPETFAPQRLKKDYNVTPIGKAEAVAAEGRTALRKLLTATDALDITRPTTYYAMIQMDGDKMGKLLSEVADEAEHSRISQTLSTFSREQAPAIVEEQYPGRLIYAGGDDVFALAPLACDYRQESPPAIKTVFDLVYQLQHQYSETVKAQVSNESNREQVSASAGIAIAHHLTSLSYVRRMSKAAEDSAKKHYGRNALVVTVLRRSGEQTRVGCRWQYKGLATDGQPVKLFTSFYELFKQDALSPKCVYILLEEAVTLVKLSKAAQQSEIRRVLQRQRSSEATLSNDAVRILAEHLTDLAEAMDKDKKPSMDENQEKSVELHSERRRYGLVEALGWLLVMLFLGRKEQE